MSNEKFGFGKLLAFVSALAIFSLWATVGGKARADIIKTVVTPVAASDRVVVQTINLDFSGRTITVYYGERNADGVSLSGGYQTVPFPDPTPAALGNIKNAVEKALAGQSSALAITPVASGTVTP